MSGTVPAKTVKVMLILIVCFVVVGETQYSLRIQAIYLTDRAKSNWYLIAQDLKKLIQGSDILLLMRNKDLGRHQLTGLLDTVNSARSEQDYYTFSMTEGLPAQYVFFYRLVLFGDSTPHPVLPDYGDYKAWFPFVMTFPMLQMRPLTLAALFVDGSVPLDGVETLAKAVAKIRADGNPFALISKFFNNVLDKMPSDSSTCKVCNPQHTSSVGPAWLFNGMVDATVTSKVLREKGLKAFSIRPLFIEISFNKLKGEPVAQGKGGSEAIGGVRSVDRCAYRGGLGATGGLDAGSGRGFGSGVGAGDGIGGGLGARGGIGGGRGYGGKRRARGGLGSGHAYRGRLLGARGEIRGGPSVRSNLRSNTPPSLSSLQLPLAPRSSQGSVENRSPSFAQSLTGDWLRQPEDSHNVSTNNNWDNLHVLAEAAANLGKDQEMKIRE